MQLTVRLTLYVAMHTYIPSGGRYRQVNMREFDTIKFM